jgi:hydroxymethylpyrimidine pyrophosphatase-like HAD family hydrolase
LQIIFNKGAVMVLPAGINKASGLVAALAHLRLSPLNVVGIGDAENDHAFLSACGCAVGVANALPIVKAGADIVAAAPRGEGVAETIRRIIETTWPRSCSGSNGSPSSSHRTWMDSRSDCTRNAAAS